MNKQFFHVKVKIKIHFSIIYMNPSLQIVPFKISLMYVLKQFIRHVSTRDPFLSESPFSVIRIGTLGYSFFIHLSIILIPYGTTRSQSEPDLIKTKETFLRYVRFCKNSLYKYIKTSCTWQNYFSFHKNFNLSQFSLFTLYRLIR